MGSIGFMNGQQNNQIIAIDGHRGIDTRVRYETERPIDRAGFQEDSFDDEINLKDLLAVVARRKSIIFFTTLFLFLITLFYTLSLTPIYRATTSIKIDTEANKLADFKDVFEEKRVDNNFHQTQYDLLKSRALAKRVIDKLELEDTILEAKAKKSLSAEYMGKVKSFVSQQIIQPIFGDTSVLDKLPADVEREKWQAKMGSEPIEMEFIKNLSLSPSKKSNVLSINYDSYDPELAAASVNTLANEFIQMNISGMSESSSYAKQYLSEQLVLAKTKLHESEAQLVKYAKEKNIIQTDGNNSLVSSSLEYLNDVYTEAQKELIAAESEYKQRNRVSGSIRMMDNPVIQQLKKQRGNLQAKYKQQLQIYKPAFPAMVQMKQEIADLERQLKLESKNINVNSKNDLQTRYQAAKQNAAMLSKKLEGKKREMLSQRDKGVGYATLQRDVETNRELFNSLSQRMKEVDIASGVINNNISIIDPAFVPYKQHTPNTMKNVAIGTLLGLMMGLALAFIRDRFDLRIRTVDDLESLVDLPVLGVFPFVKGKNKKKNRGKDGAISLTDNHQSAEYEAFRSLVTNMGYLDSKGLPKLIHITSSSPAEGKSNVAINMATIIAENNLKVLLIDADLRKPRVDSYLSLSADNGLAEYLLNKCEMDEIIVDSPAENLSIVTAGKPSPSPAKLLAEDKMIGLLDYAIEEYDHVIIDSPPVLGLADALILSNRADVTLFVVASNETKRPHLLDALKRLRLGYGNVVGFVLTKAKSSKLDYYNYESYYGYQRDDVLKLENGVKYG